MGARRRCARLLLGLVALTLIGAASSLAGSSPAVAAPSVVTPPLCPASVDTPTEGWVCMLYNLELRRAPGDAEVAYWSGIAGSAGTAAVTYGIGFSVEAAALEVKQLYATSLGRAVDAGGLAFWSALISSDVSERRFEQEVLGSAEMLATFSGTSAWVRHMYFRLLGRDADPAGLTFWTNARQSGQMTGPQVVSALLLSTEGGARTTSIAYRDMVDRAADPGGLAFWTPRAAVVGLDRVQADLAAQPEGVATLGAQATSGSPDYPLPVVQILDAVLAAPVAPNSPCPSAAGDHEAPSAATGRTVVVCGRVLAPRPVRPTGATLSGDFVALGGTFTTGRVVPTNTTVVIGSFSGVGITNAVGAHNMSVAIQADEPGRISTGATSTIGGYNALNNPPAANDDTASTSEDASVVISVRANDTDVDAGETLTVTATGGTPDGQVFISDGGTTVTYDPNGQFDDLAAGQTDTDIFSYQLTDSHGGSDIAFVTVTINGADEGPVLDTTDTPGTATEQVATAVDPGVTVTHTVNIASATVQITGGYVNGQDVLALPGGQPGGITGSFNAATATLTLSGSTTPANYQTALRAVTYTASSDAPSTALRTFTFVATDVASLASAPVTRSLTVIPANDPPTDAGESLTATGNTRLEVELTSGQTANPRRTSATGNLFDNATDPDDVLADLSIVSVSDPANGSVTVNPDGSWVYTPDVGFTGADSFTYEVSDDGGAQSSTSTASITVGNRVWYVRADAVPGGDGRSETPFDTLPVADVAADLGTDVIFVFRRTGDIGAVSDNSVDLLAGHTLLGSAVNLTDGAATLYTGSEALRPSLIATSVKLSDGNTVKGLAISGSGSGAAAIVGGNADTGGTLDNLVLTGSTGGLDLDGTDGTITVSNLVVNTTGGTAVRLNGPGAVVFPALGQISITASGGRGLDATGTQFGTSTFDDITVSSSPVGAIELIATGATSLALGDDVGTDLSLTTTGGTAFHANVAFGLVVGSDGTDTISATGGPALDVAGPATLAFDDIDSSGSSGDGINLQSFGVGTFSAGTGSTIGTPTGVGFDVDGGSGAVSFDGTVTAGTGARSVEITNRTGSTVDFNGLVTDNGLGISLTGNAGATIRFDGGVVASTGANNAFLASGSGTVVVTDTNGTTAPNNTLETTTGTALSVIGTTIGAEDLTFQSISADGALNAVVLNATGLSGGLHVTGSSSGVCGGQVTAPPAFTVYDPADCTGGLITNTTDAAISLNSTADVSLTRIHVIGSGTSAIAGDEVTGFSLTSSALIANAAGGTTALVAFDDAYGDVDITSSTIGSTSGSALELLPSAATPVDLAVTGTLIGQQEDGTDGSAIAVLASGAAEATVTVDTSILQDASNAGLRVDQSGTGTVTVLASDSAYVGNQSGIFLQHGGTGDMTFNIARNTLVDTVLEGIVYLSESGVTNGSDVNGAITGNTIGDGSVDSGSKTSVGISLLPIEDVDAIFDVSGNVVSNTDQSGFVFSGAPDASADGEVALVDLTYRDNVIGTPEDNETVPIGSVYGTLIEAREQLDLCVDIADNSSASTAGLEAFRVRQRDTSTFRLERYAGSPTDANQVAAFIAAQNAVGSTASVTIDGAGFTGVADGACRDVTVPAI